MFSVYYADITITVNLIGDLKIMDDRIDAIERVLDKRASRGQSDQSLIHYLENLKENTYSKSPAMIFAINGFVDAIKQTPLTV